jgi:hypothetical protein
LLSEVIGLFAETTATTSAFTAETAKLSVIAMLANAFRWMCRTIERFSAQRGSARWGDLASQADTLIAHLPE